MATGTIYKQLFRDKQVNLISGIDLIEAELKMLFSLPKYSLFFGNEIGIDLEKYLQLHNKIAAFNLIKNDIENFFLKYKRASLIKIEIQFIDIESKLVINLTVSIGGNIRNLPLVLSNEGVKV